MVLAVDVSDVWTSKQKSNLFFSSERYIHNFFLQFLPKLCIFAIVQVVLFCVFRK